MHRYFVENGSDEKISRRFSTRFLKYPTWKACQSSENKYHAILLFFFYYRHTLHQNDEVQLGKWRACSALLSHKEKIHPLIYILFQPFTFEWLRNAPFLTPSRDKGNGRVGLITNKRSLRCYFPDFASIEYS